MDGCSGVIVYLSKQCLDDDVSIVSSKCSEMNIVLPGKVNFVPFLPPPFPIPHALSTLLISAFLQHLCRGCEIKRLSYFPQLASPVHCRRKMRIQWRSLYPSSLRLGCATASLRPLPSHTLEPEMKQTSWNLGLRGNVSSMAQQLIQPTANSLQKSVIYGAGPVLEDAKHAGCLCLRSYNTWLHQPTIRPITNHKSPITNLPA